MTINQFPIGKYFLLLLFISCGVFHLKGQNNPPKKIHVIRMLDFFSDHQTGGYAMRNASSNIRTYFESKTRKLADDVTGGQVQYYDVFDDPEATPLSHNPFNEPEKNKFSKSTIIQTLQDISCEGDVVMVVYNGHGFSAKNNRTVYDNTGGKINYPDLVFSYDEPESEDHYIPYNEILCALQKKKPALIVSVISACQIELEDVVDNMIAENYDAYTQEFQSNFISAGMTVANYNTTTNEIAIRKARANELFKVKTNPAYNQLRVNQSLSVELLSCSKGEYTWVDVEGGHFMSSFIDAFNEALESPQAISWEYIAANTKFKTENRIKAFNHYELSKGTKVELHAQTPQCKVYIKETGNCTAMPNSLRLPTINANGTSQAVVVTSKTYFQYADHLAGKRKTPYWLAKRFVKLGESYRAVGSPRQAIATLNTAIPVLKRNKDYYRLATAYERLGLAYRDVNETKLARESLLKAKDWFVKLKVDGSISVIEGLIEQVGR